MVSNLRTPILKSFYYLLWFKIVTVSEFSCLAKSFPVSGQVICPRFLASSISSKRVHMKCLVLSWRPESCQFSHKIICLFIKPFQLHI